jgi:hypothetical protein
MNPVRLRHPYDDVVVVGAWQATAEERASAMARSMAAFRMRSWRRGAVDAYTLADLYALAFGHSVAVPRGDTTDVLLRRVEEAVERGLLLLLMRPRPLVVVPLMEVDSEPVLGPAPDDEDVEFDITYADGSPASGLAYVLTDSGGTKTKGTFGSDGVVHRKSVTGTYALAITAIDLVDWDRRTANAGQEVTVIVRTSGVDDGGAVSVKIYRMWDEDPAKALATLALTVQQNKATGTWKYTPSSPDESGVASFVAEASVQGGAIWSKGPSLPVDLPTVLAAVWSDTTVTPGGSVDLLVQTRGFADGAEVSVALYEHDVDGSDKKLGDVTPPPIQRRVTSATLACADGAALPAYGADVYAKVTVKKDGIERTACSPFLWIDTAQPAEVA